MHLKIGSRQSQLAVTQAEIFCKELDKVGNFTYEIIKIKTSGDKILDKPLYDIGGKALFLKELEDALIKSEIDIAVHSLKDVPGQISDQFFIGGYIKRDSPFDALISFKNYKSIHDLPPNSVIGTSSPRRMAMMKKIRPDLKLEFIRGNINSRIEKLRNGQYDAIILAAAGIKRLNMWDENFCTIIPVDEVIPAVGQGVIAAEILSSRSDLIDILNLLSDSETKICSEIEREFLSFLNADCKTPLASYIFKKNDIYEANFMLADDDGNNIQSTNMLLNDRNLKGSGIKAAQILKEQIK